MKAGMSEARSNPYHAVCYNIHLTGEIWEAIMG